MSEFSVFTKPQLKQICVHTGISNFIKFSVSKPELIQQIEKYLDFDGYNFTIKETNQQQFLQSDLLKKVHKPKISSKDKKILQIAKKEIQDIKGDVNTIKDYIDDYMKNIQLLTNFNKVNPQIEDVPEIYPKKLKKNINLKVAKANLNKLIKPKKIKIKKIDFVPEVPEENPTDVIKLYDDNMTKVEKKIKKQKLSIDEAFDERAKLFNGFEKKYGMSIGNYKKLYDEEEREASRIEQLNNKYRERKENENK